MWKIKIHITYNHPQLLIMKRYCNSTDRISLSNIFSYISLQKFNKAIPLALIDCTFVIKRYKS